MNVLRIDIDSSTALLSWPDDEPERRLLIQGEVGSPLDTGVYHRQAVMHVHGDGERERLPLNHAAWTLACSWRRLELPYGLYGIIVITGPNLQGLDPALVAEAQAVCGAVADVRALWLDRPPVGEGPARAELLAAARHAMVGLR
ncbi:hypothetical protein [Streptomyces sp. NPDC089799]|uniref:hypothetical protein n=1 Tax=Streptomyces sp. NPDC089799 TaxID=3155066 RepID=UPI00344A5419